jgi:hypothetical protein
VVGITPGVPLGAFVDGVFPAGMFPFLSKVGDFPLLPAAIKLCQYSAAALFPATHSSLLAFQQHPLLLFSLREQPLESLLQVSSSLPWMPQSSNLSHQIC